MTVVIVVIKMVNIIMQMGCLPVLKLLTVIFICFCVAPYPGPLQLAHVSHTTHPLSPELSLRNFMNPDGYEAIRVRVLRCTIYTRRIILTCCSNIETYITCHSRWSQAFVSVRSVCIL